MEGPGERSREPSQGADGGAGPAARVQVVSSKWRLEILWRKSRQDLLVNVMWVWDREGRRGFGQLESGHLWRRRPPEEPNFFLWGDSFGALEGDGI